MIALNNIEYLKIALTLFGGGAAGAIITALVTNRRNRVQPIGTFLIVRPIFVSSDYLKDHLTQITFSGTKDTYHFDNLYYVQTDLKNIGNKDYSEFKFGITFPSGVKAVTQKFDTQDRHHKVVPETTISFDSPSEFMDFSLRPFNRKDKYSLSFYVTCESEELPGDLRISTEMPAKFVDYKVSMGEILPIIWQMTKRTYLGIPFDDNK